MNIEIIPMQRLGDERGALIALEENKNVPFTVRRVYYLFDTQEGVRRGLHAHKQLRQLVIPVRGSCRFILDDGRERIELVLGDPGTGLLLESMIWREMCDFSHDCVLMVLADQLYDEQDYIRDYDEFLRQAKLRHAAASGTINA
ncbi:FdtA/QdtA family cupin domain-containing protein [Crenobacter sp. SG2305]|uniref:sugar 3,4-ketoisomerase n=1 Tax=Crenobacter oryzisoli TaxID=3056844 RepID=UPI0025AAB158|nr:FdtA/QdtA family cupin domain-containing protein [Crenobacter sp. SG2305]MDN0082654.1 FdtA/QdtA family cupin domain-containing protein [Crenobacter sp. SG2305]